MLELDEVARLAGVHRSELTAWIEERWVLPVQAEGRWRFGDVDVARVRLIVELQRDLDIGADALPVVLSLLDRVNTLRRGLRTVCEAVAELPDAQRQAVRQRIEELHRGD